jgi:hypothetical protein
MDIVPTPDTSILNRFWRVLAALGGARTAPRKGAQMSKNLRWIGLSLIVVLATSGCAPMTHLVAGHGTPPQLEAWGPGTVFPSIEAAAVDALIYTYLQASSEQDTQRMRAGRSTAWTGASATGRST